MEKKTFIIDDEALNVRLDIFLVRQLKDHSRTTLKNLVNDGAVLVNGHLVKPHYSLKRDDSVEIIFPEAKAASVQPENIPFEIIFEDDDILVVNKPYGIVVHPGAGNTEATLVNALLHHTQNLSTINPERPGIVHRLDKETSGVMVVAKNNAAHLELARQFKDHSISRRYIALVKGQVKFTEGIIDAPIDRHPVNRKKMAVSYGVHARGAQTHYHALKVFENFTLLELKPQTGRTHQLRVHLSFLKHPILGDSKYGDKHDFPRLALHAKDLGFVHPSKGEWVEFSSVLPPEMQSAIGKISV